MVSVMDCRPIVYVIIVSICWKMYGQLFVMTIVAFAAVHHRLRYTVGWSRMIGLSSYLRGRWRATMTASVQFVSYSHSAGVETWESFAGVTVEKSSLRMRWDKSDNMMNNVLYIYHPMIVLCLGSCLVSFGVFSSFWRAHVITCSPVKLLYFLAF